jgi:pyruvate formate lyase activating enzyme
MAADATRAALRIGGLTPLSATDYPGQLAAVVFCQGCPWRCGYCHNPHLLDARAATALTWRDVLAFLRRRQGLLDAVVFSGGEPLAQRGLAAAMRAALALGFRVGLHTGGAYPARLAEVLPLTDWVGFDAKADFGAYAAITQVAGSGAAALASARLLLASGVAHEFRTTVHPDRHDAAAIEALAARLAGLGVRHYVLQAFRPGRCLDLDWAHPVRASFLAADYAALPGAGFRTFELRA